MRAVEFEKIRISDDVPSLVIPEIGINHSGNFQTAKEMVDSAFRAGAKLIKHQTHVCWDEMSKAAKEVIPGNSTESIYSIMDRCALDEDEEKELKDYVEAKGMFFLSTPFSRAAADRLERFGAGAYKIGSGEMNNYPLIEHISEFGKPMIVSTGMNDLKAIEKTIKIMEKHGVSYALMHTTNLYPTKPEWVRLGAMQEMMDVFPGIPIGLSDHTINNVACISAMALGACLVERHFTDRLDRIGPDIVCSMDEYQLVELLNAAQDVFLMRGGHKKPISEEQVTIDFAFATVVSIQDIKQGEKLTKDNIWVRRPGTGKIKAEQYEDLLGKEAAVNIPNDTQLTKEMVKR